MIFIHPSVLQHHEHTNPMTVEDDLNLGNNHDLNRELDDDLDHECDRKNDFGQSCDFDHDFDSSLALSFWSFFMIVF